MKSILLGSLVATSLSTVASGQSFDWPSQLGKPLSDFQSVLGAAAQCEPGGFSVPVKSVSLETTLEDDLYDPVRTDDFAPIDVSGKVDLSFDRDEKRSFKVDRVSHMTCVLGREATATAYAADDRVVRIDISYDRCQSREKRKLFGFESSNVEFWHCDGVDLAEKDFDTALFQGIKARESYGYTRQGQPPLLDLKWSKMMRGDYEAAERRTIVGFGCSGRNEFDSEVSRRPDDEAYRCLIDVDNADPTRWSATAMYEVFRPGVISNDVTSRLTSKRVFVDMPAEKAAAAAIRAELQAMIDGIKNQISARQAQKSSDEGAVSNILGAQN
jgi:hypothetical protein